MLMAHEHDRFCTALIHFLHVPQLNLVEMRLQVMIDRSMVMITCDERRFDAVNEKAQFQLIC